MFAATGIGMWCVGWLLERIGTNEVMEIITRRVTTIKAVGRALKISGAATFLVSVALLAVQYMP